MIRYLFAVYDNKAQAFYEPWCVNNLMLGQRHFANCAKDPKHPFGMNPTDYTLFHIGNYDDSNGVVEGVPGLSNLGLAASYLENDIS